MVRMSGGKTYIPDTNIAIDDAYFMRDFLKDKDNKIILPDIVLGELDRLKKHPEVGYEAREFIEHLHSLIPNDVRLSDGISMPLTPDGTLIGGKFFITNKYRADDGADLLTYHPDIGDNDLNIIRSAAVYHKDNPGEDVILVSNDKNVVNVARINGIKAEYMRKDSADPSKLGDGYRIFRPSKGLLNYVMQASKEPLPVSEIDEPWIQELVANEYVVFVNDAVEKAINDAKEYDARSTFAIEPRFIKRYDIGENALVDIRYQNQPLFGVTPRNLEQLLLIDQLLDNNIHIKAVRADPGTGKSFIELAVALYKTIERRKKKNDDSKVYIIRRAVMIEEYGFLPGDITDKNMHTYEGVDRNYSEIMKLVTKGGSMSYSYPAKLSDALKEIDGIIEILPFGTIRGITVGPKCIVIGEEWQNTEIKYSKIMMDRNGDGEVFLNGDSTQTDNPHTSPERNGLTYIIKRIEDISRRARETRHPLDLYDASICGALTLKKAERGIINAWSQRNLPSRMR